jgi:hypothetical protein
MDSGPNISSGKTIRERMHICPQCGPDINLDQIDVRTITSGHSVYEMSMGGPVDIKSSVLATIAGSPICETSADNVTCV